MVLLGPLHIACSGLRVANSGKHESASSLVIYLGVQVTAFHEFESRGEFGELGLQLLRTLMNQELSRFSALTQHETEDLWDYVQKFFKDRGKKLTAALKVNASDESSFGKYIRSSINNWLIDQIRKTDLGAMRRQIEELLETNSCFHRVPEGEAGAGRWQIDGSSSGPWGGDPSQLDAVAASISIHAVRSKGSQRRPPLGSRKELVALIEAILVRAGGSLETAQIVDVFTRRFPGALRPIQVSLDTQWTEGTAAIDRADTNSFGDPERTAIEAEENFDLEHCALRVFGQLQPQERQIALVLGNVTAVQSLLGCGRSTAYLQNAKVAELIKELAGNNQDPYAVLLALQDLCHDI